MYTLQNLEITHILPKKEGIFVFAKYPNWWTEFSFLIEPDGKILGKTHQVWTEITQEFSEFIKTKVQSTLIEKTSLVYS